MSEIIVADAKKETKREILMPGLAECCNRLSVYDQNKVETQTFKVLGKVTSFSYIICSNCKKKKLIPEK